MRTRRDDTTEVFGLSTTRALFDKATRERDRFNGAIELEAKSDHFVNFCVSASAALDRFDSDVKRLARAQQQQDHAHAARAVMDRQEVFSVVRSVANAYKHPWNGDVLIQGARAETQSFEKAMTDRKLDLASHPDAIDGDRIEVRLSDASATVAQTALMVTLKDGRQVQAWHLMTQCVTAMERIFSVAYRVDPSAG